MSAFLDRLGRLTPKQLLLVALEQQETIEALQTRDAAPIAICGMACRFPGGAEDPDAFWRLLDEGRDAIRPIPADRWDAEAYFDADPSAPGRIGVRNGGFLDTVSGFDAAFFGIAQREARSMDPQQRLLLELSWEALERAGLPADRLYGKPAGVFVGLCNSDHFTRLLGHGDADIDAYLASGNAPSVAAGRVAYCLGLQGPALTVDTACSSSLVALHLACRSLRAGESAVALVGGVNVMCAPQTSIALTKSHMLAPDGRCKTFDAAADGFARGEGCGVLVLKRLDEAVADGLPVLAVIRGTATNQDGRSAGLTVPNGPAQEAVIRAALADARLAPDDIDYVEAHGTGTALGDPIEIRALAAALGRGRSPDRPLRVGSVKTNIGHLESAAGIAGVIKVVLALQHGRIPRHLHFRTPSPHIPWSDIPVRVTAAEEPWQPGERKRRAGVSSFGFSGSNAHVVLEEPPAPAKRPSPAGAAETHCLPLSARSAAALRELARRAARTLEAEPQPALGDVARLAGSGRAHHGHRLAVVASSVAEARSALAAAADDRPHPALRLGADAAQEPPEVVFLFTGQGSQYLGMGRALYASNEAFRATIDACDAILGADAAGLTLKAVLWEAAGALDETVWTQPALVAIEIAAARMWQSFGIEPAAVIGHSLGEYAAACVAGVFPLADCLRLVAARGRLTQAIGGGGMAAFFTSADALAAGIRACGGSLAIAAVNAPDSVVASGDAAALDRLVAYFAARGIEARRLQVSFPAHSPLVEPALDRLEEAARGVTMAAPAIPVAWNRGGLSRNRPDAAYWRHHLRDPVLFGDGVAALHAAGYRTFLEVGPHPTLSALAQRALDDPAVAWLTTMRRGKPDRAEVGASLADLYLRGADVTWRAVEPPAPPVAWPTYPFERRFSWLTPGARFGDAVRAGPEGAEGVFPGRRLPTALPAFQTVLASDCPSWLGAHRVGGHAVASGPVFIALAETGAAAAYGPARRVLADLVLREPLVLPDGGRAVQVQFGPGAEAGVPFTVHSRSEDDSWILHAAGRVAAAPLSADAPSTLDLAALRAAMGPSVDLDSHRGDLAALGIVLGPPARGLREAWRGAGEALGRVQAPAELDAGAFDPAVTPHPAVLDAALQTVGLAVPPRNDALFLLAGLARVALDRPLPAEFWTHVRLRDSASAASASAIVADLTLADPDGRVLGRIEGISLRRSERRDALQYAVRWDAARPEPRARLAAPDHVLPDLRARFAPLAAERGLSVYDTLLPELDTLAVAYIARALLRIGFDDTLGRLIDPPEEAARLGILPRFGRLFGRMLAILAEEGVLTRTGPAFTIARPLPAVDPDALGRDILARHGTVGGELATLTRCGAVLDGVLKGSEDPLQHLFLDGSLTEARRLYEESPYAQTYNTILAAALAAATGRAEGTRLRVLEIGAGTGGTTGFALPVLPADRTDYAFTDLSPLFLERAAERFAAYPFVRRALLDIEQDPGTQGFPAGSQDVVIAANVLHATADLAQSLRHVRALLPPGGLLLLLEGVAPERWVDLTFGLTEGWWRFADTALRPDYPLVDAATWTDVLTAAGFDQIAICGATPGSRSQGHQAFIMARAGLAPRTRVVVGGGAAGDALAARLGARGDRVVRVDPESADAGPLPDGDLVYLAALDLADRDLHDTSALPDSARLAYDLPLRLLARAARGEGTGRAWLVTRGAQAAAGAPAPGGRWQAPLWGLGRVFALEQPARWGGLVDLDPASPAHAEPGLTALLEALDAPDGEDQVAYRAGERLAARLVRRAPAGAGPDAARLVLRPDATYLVTGGFGGLGLIAARWLADRGARHIALIGRRPRPDDPAIRAIEAAGARVICLACDVADAAALRTTLDRLDREAPPLRGILHAAAALTAAPLQDLGAEARHAMARSKIDGLVALEQAMRGRPVAFLVLFSTTTALLGATGFAHYAAANAFLDATAEAQAPRPGAARSDPQVLSVNWGTWSSMRAASAEDRRAFLEAGLAPLSTEEALGTLEALLVAGEARATVARIDWAVLKPLHEARRPRPFLAALEMPVARPATGPAAGGAAAPSGLGERVAKLPEADRRAAVLAFVAQTVAVTLGRPADEPIPPRLGLFEMGMDSLMAVELKRQLEKGVGRALPSTLTFNHPNVAALADYLTPLLAPPQPARTEAPPAAPPVPPRPTPEPEALAALTDDELERRLLARLEEVE
jgi:acyl transferase domain-containing protein/acyl carrier protein